MPDFETILAHPRAALWLALFAELMFVIKDGTVQHLEEVYRLPTAQILLFIMVSLSFPVMIGTV